MEQAASEATSTRKSCARGLAGATPCTRRPLLHEHLPSRVASACLAKLYVHSMRMYCPAQIWEKRAGRRADMSP